MQRQHFLQKISELFQSFPIVALIGPRQCGKTTLARQYASECRLFNPMNYFDLEDFTDFDRLENPRISLSPLEGLVVIDEIQRLPSLFPALRVLVDAPDSSKRFLILGSASRHLIEQSSESLAGRIVYLELTPFSVQEVNAANALNLQQLDSLWLRGGYPKSYLSENDPASFRWREAYIRTYLEQDIRALGITISPVALRRFWMMLTGYHGQTFNASEMGKSLGLSDKTTRNYLDILAGTFMVRLLPPWFENIQKRQVKSPKIYFRDSGLYHALLDLTDGKDLFHSRYLGASWEGFALEEVIRAFEATPEQTYYWGIHGQAELDLLIVKNGQKLGFEFKYSDPPKMTSSMESALTHLNLDRLTVISPGEHQFPLHEKVVSMGLSRFLLGVSENFFNINRVEGM
jgi:predicted AAA+ superfamily ATPase